MFAGLRYEVDDGDESDNHKQGVYDGENQKKFPRGIPHHVILLPWIVDVAFRNLINA